MKELFEDEINEMVKTRLTEEQKECCEKCFKWGNKYGEYVFPCNEPTCSCHPQEQTVEERDKIWVSTYVEADGVAVNISRKNDKWTMAVIGTKEYIVDITDLFKTFGDELLAAERSRVRERVSGMKKDGEMVPAPCPDEQPGCLVYHQQKRITPEVKAYNQALDDVLEAI